MVFYLGATAIFFLMALGSEGSQPTYFSQLIFDSFIPAIIIIGFFFQTFFFLLVIGFFKRISIKSKIIYFVLIISIVAITNSLVLGIVYIWNNQYQEKQADEQRTFYATIADYRNNVAPATNISDPIFQLNLPGKYGSYELLIKFSMVFPRDIDLFRWGNVFSFGFSSNPDKIMPIIPDCSSKDVNDLWLEFRDKKTGQQIESWRDPNKSLVGSDFEVTARYTFNGSFCNDRKFQSLVGQRFLINYIYGLKKPDSLEPIERRTLKSFLINKIQTH